MCGIVEVMCPVCDRVHRVDHERAVHCGENGNRFCRPESGYSTWFVRFKGDKCNECYRDLYQREPVRAITEEIAEVRHCIDYLIRNMQDHDSSPMDYRDIEEVEEEVLRSARPRDSVEQLIDDWTRRNAERREADEHGDKKKGRSNRSDSFKKTRRDPPGPSGGSSGGKNWGRISGVRRPKT